MLRKTAIALLLILSVPMFAFGDRIITDLSLVLRDEAGSIPDKKITNINTSDPRTGTGISAPSGSLALGLYNTWMKYGNAADTDWKKLINESNIEQYVGDPRYNLIQDPSFESGNKGTCTAATATPLCASTSRTVQVKPYDTSMYQMNASALDSLTWTFNLANGEFSGEVILMGVEVRTAVTDATVTFKVDGVEQKSFAVNSDDKWHTYEFEVTGGSIDYDIVVAGTAGNGTYIRVDNLYIGKRLRGLEKIKSTPLIQIEYGKSSSQTLTNLAYTPISDWGVKWRDNSGGAFNASTGEFTSPRDSSYKICTSLLTNSVAWDAGELAAAQLYLSPSGRNIQLSRRDFDATRTAFAQVSDCTDVELPKGERVTFRVYQNSDADIGSYSGTTPEVYNRFSITELPDMAALVKQMNENYNIECEVKYLPADVDGAGDMPEISFSNLTIGEQYIIDGKARFAGGATPAAHVFIQYYHDTVSVLSAGFKPQANEYDVRSFSSLPFVATTTSVAAKAESLQTTDDTLITGNDSPSMTWARICKLSDNYVETTKF